MNIPFGRSHRLASRGGVGLACDQSGVSLGPIELVRVEPELVGPDGCKVRSFGDLYRILTVAYGQQPLEVVERLHRGLQRTAAWIEAGDIGRAGVEAIMLRVPELTSSAMAKLSQLADLEKGAAAWENEARVPAGQVGGGQWTTDGGANATGGSTTTAPPRPAVREVKPHAKNDKEDREAPSGRSDRSSLLDDGVYRPAVDRPFLIPTGGVDEDESPRRGSNGPPPDELTSLEEVFPGLKNAPLLSIPLAPIDGFLGISAGADAANLDATMMLYDQLVDEIRSVRPGFQPANLTPAGGIAGMSWQGRTNLLNDLRMQRAAAFYNVRGDAGPLQVETLRFLQGDVDSAYAEGVREYNAGRLQPRLSRQEALGNFVDIMVRQDLREQFNNYGIRYGSNGNIRINNRDYDTSGSMSTYRVPDARIGNVSFDWTLAPKTISTPQVRGFFGADANPNFVIIIRPSVLGPNSTYLISRPSSLSRAGD